MPAALSFGILCPPCDKNAKRSQDYVSVAKVRILTPPLDKAGSK